MAEIKKDLAIGNDLFIYSRRGWVASVTYERKEAHGNARLIAAAPTMLGVLEAIAKGLSTTTARALARKMLADLGKNHES